MLKKRLGEVLTERGLLSDTELEEALEAQGTGPGRLAEILADAHSLSKADLGAALEAVNGMPYVECPPSEIDPEVLALIPGPLAARCCALPIATEGQTLVVAMGEPQHMGVLEELEFASGMTISPRFSFRSDVVAGIATFYNRTAEFIPDENISHSAVPIPASGRMSRGAAAALFLGCCVAAFGTWQAATLASDAIGSRPNAPQETMEPVAQSVGRPTETGLAATVGVPAAPRGQSPSTDRNSAPSSVSPATPESAGGAGGVNPETAGVALASEMPSTASRFGSEIQVGVFREIANADRLVDTLGSTHGRVDMSLSSTGLYVVSLGPFPQKQMADSIAQEVRAETGLTPLVRQVGLD